MWRSFVKHYFLRMLHLQFSMYFLLGVYQLNTKRCSYLSRATYFLSFFWCLLLKNQDSWMCKFSKCFCLVFTSLTPREMQPTSLELQNFLSFFWCLPVKHQETWRKKFSKCFCLVFISYTPRYLATSLELHIFQVLFLVFTS